MEAYFNSLPFRQSVIFGSCDCGYIGFGWRIPRCRRRCHRRRQHRCRHFLNSPFCRFSPFGYPGFPGDFGGCCQPFLGGEFGGRLPFFGGEFGGRLPFFGGEFGGHRPFFGGEFSTGVF